MHEQKTLVVRNPGRPTKERLPCRLDRDELLAKMNKRMALERTREQIDAEIESHKSRLKALLNGLAEDRAEVDADMRTLREEILDGTEERLVDCELLEDIEAGSIYVFRLDDMTVAQRRDMAPAELKERRDRPQLKLADDVHRTVDVPGNVESVRRFDSDPPGVEDQDEDDKDDKAAATGGTNGSTYGHEHSYDDGACIVCGEVDPDADKPPAEAAKPVRRKKGEKAAEPATREGFGSAKKKGRSFDDRGAPAGRH